MIGISAHEIGMSMASVYVFQLMLINCIICFGIHAMHQMKSISTYDRIHCNVKLSRMWQIFMQISPNSGKKPWKSIQLCISLTLYSWIFETETQYQVKNRWSSKHRKAMISNISILQTMAFSWRKMIPDIDSIFGIIFLMNTKNIGILVLIFIK